MYNENYTARMSFLLQFVACLAATTTLTLSVPIQKDGNEMGAQIAKSGFSGGWLVYAKPIDSQDDQMSEQLDRQKRETSNSTSVTISKKKVIKKGKKKNNKKKLDDFLQDCLNTHNNYRRAHQAPDLKWDTKIQAFAQKRAEHIAKSDGAEFRHPDNLEFGENLAWHSRDSTSCEDLIKMWYDEISLYNFPVGGFSLETGHFTQLIWRQTNRVGCARAISSGPRGGIYLVCNYDPAGNWANEYLANVLPAMIKATSKAVTTTTETSTTKSRELVTVIGDYATISTTSVNSVTTIAPKAADQPETSTRQPEKKKKDKKKRKKKNKKKKNKGKKKPEVTTTTLAPSS